MLELSFIVHSPLKSPSARHTLKGHWTLTCQALDVEQAFNWVHHCRLKVKTLYNPGTMCMMKNMFQKEMRDMTAQTLVLKDGFIDVTRSHKRLSVVSDCMQTCIPGGEGVHCVRETRSLPMCQLLIINGDKRLTSLSGMDFSPAEGNDPFPSESSWRIHTTVALIAPYIHNWTTKERARQSSGLLKKGRKI